MGRRVIYEIFTRDLKDASHASNQLETGFNIHKLNKLIFSQEHPKKLENFTLLHIIKGSGQFKLALEGYSIRNQTMYFAYPGQIISGIALNDLDGYLMYGNLQFMLKAIPELLDLKLFQLYGLRHEIELTSEYHEKLINLNKNILDEYAINDFRKEEILQSLVNLHVYYTDRIMYQQYFKLEKSIHPKVRSFFAIMNMQHTVNLKVSDYAEKLNIGPNYLNELVRKQTGKSVKTIIKEKTLRQACVYLIHTGQEVKEIAYNLGYNYPQYFVRDFKANYGITPIQYRNTHH